MGDDQHIAGDAQTAAEKNSLLVVDHQIGRYTDPHLTLTQTQINQNYSWARSMLKISTMEYTSQKNHLHFSLTDLTLKRKLKSRSQILILTVLWLMREIYSPKRYTTNFIDTQNWSQPQLPSLPTTTLAFLF